MSIWHRSVNLRHGLRLDISLGRRVVAAVVGGLAVAVSPVLAQAPAFLVKDINQTANSGGSNPASLVDVNGTLFFTAWTPTAGAELWKSDGTAAGTVLVKDIRPGSAPWYTDLINFPPLLTNVDGTLFFVADDGVNGRELWKSDGTTAGTVLVKDIWPGREPTDPTAGPSSLTSVNGRLFFVANDGVHGWELWKSDGTETGTVMVRNIWPDSEPQYSSESGPSLLTNVNGTLFFRADDRVHRPGLWESDGTAEGTAMVNWTRGGPGFLDVDPSSLTEVNGTLFFSANDGVHGWELWKTDGTADGTVLVMDISLGSGSSMPDQLVPVNGVLFFAAADAVHGRELWKSDGTATGTVLVKDIVVGSLSSYPSLLTNVNGTLFFVANDGVHGWELWKSDSAAEGTALVKDIWPGSEPADHSNGPSSLTNVNGTLFFTANDQGHGYELWKSDGTAEGTILVKDIWPGSKPSTGYYLLGPAPYSLTNVNGTLFFVAIDGVHGWEPWKSDGTEAGTVLVKDILGGSVGSDPSLLTDVSGTLFFGADDGVNGHELWKSDGTVAGTVLVKDIWPGSEPTYRDSGPFLLTDVNGTLFFVADDGLKGYELWKSDGTAAGTALVKDFWPLSALRFVLSSALTNVNGTLFFAQADWVYGWELWKSDGTTDGTVMVKDIWPGRLSSLPSGLTNVSGTLFFAANDGMNGSQLWKSDGTAAGTAMVKDIWPGGMGSNPNGFTEVSGTFFFAADDGYGYELWKSDGTAEGTVLVKDIRPDGGSDPFFLTNVGGTLFFVANDGVHGYELWKSDGTEAGTVLVKDIWPANEPTGPDVGPSLLTNVNGTLFFVAYDGVHGWELWKSDGTEAGTVLVKDIWPGSESSIDYWRGLFTNVDGALFFAASDGAHGWEPWKSDGTEAGTVLVADIAPGSGDSNPGPFVAVGSLLLFPATTDQYGTELWGIDLSPPQCVGDCNGDRQVTVDELVKGVNIALGLEAVSECLQFDKSGDHKVTVDELVLGVNNALNGCPARQ